MRDRFTADICVTPISAFVAVYLETYGCQMNVNDTEIAWAILQKNGYTRTKEVDEVRQLLWKAGLGELHTTKS